jgi:hypothetical protein
LRFFLPCRWNDQGSVSIVLCWQRSLSDLPSRLGGTERLTLRLVDVDLLHQILESFERVQ